jgi:hypothetical protein
LLGRNASYSSLSEQSPVLLALLLAVLVRRLAAEPRPLALDEEEASLPPSELHLSQLDRPLSAEGGSKG